MGILNIWERIWARHSVPSQNSSDNIDMADVIGNKTDNSSGDSAYSILHILEEHAHDPSKVYPTLADGVNITGGAGSWVLGSFVELIPASTITDKFDIHWVHVEAVSANDTYELVLYSGELGSEVEICRARFTKSTTAGAGASEFHVQTPIIPANTRISAKLASSGGGDNVDISIQYHEY